MTASPSIKALKPSTCPVLSRAFLADGGAESLIRREAPNVKVSDAAERATSLEAFMQSRPSGDLWVFAYGSLIWNPAMKTVESRRAHLDGWHRSFCLSMLAGRGSANCPGLALGLEPGGHCAGVAYKIGEEDITTELPLLWQREMLLGGYLPKWVELKTEGGDVFGKAIAFVIDESDDLYAGNLSLAAITWRLGTASGSWGSSADYLFRTRSALRARGISDPYIDRLDCLVRQFVVAQAAALLTYQ